MLTIALIAFREFLEAFLFAGIFLGISKKLALHKEKEIAVATLTGVILSFLLSAGVYLLGDLIKGVMTEERIESIESVIMIFSGLFIVYVVLSLHSVMSKSQKKILDRAKQKMSGSRFDAALFLTVTLLILREGFEIALFTSSVSLFSAFVENMWGLLLGFISSSVLGLGAYFAFVKFPINKVFKATQYLIILMGASLFQLGITEFVEIYFKLHLSSLGSLELAFLPGEETPPGHLLKSLLGVDHEFSLMRLLVMVFYVLFIYFLFRKKLKAQEKLPQTP